MNIKIIIWQLGFIIILFTLIYFIIKFIKKKSSNKILILFLITTLISSCQNSDDSNYYDSSKIKITNKRELDKYILTKNKNFFIPKNINNELNYKIIQSNSINFETFEEFDMFLNEISSKGLTDFKKDLCEDQNGESNENCTGGDKDNYYRVQTMIGVFTYFNIGFNINNCTGSNLTSWISGNTIGISYNHQGSSVNTINNHIQYSAYGVLNYNIFVEGIGTIFSENISRSGVYTCN